MGSIVAGIIVAAVAGTAALIGSKLDDQREAQRLGRQKQYIEDNYLLNKKRAEEEFAQAKEQAERNAAQAEKQADLTDQSLDIAEESLSQDFNATIDDLYLNEMADTQNWNISAMQAGSSEGAAYSNLAASGVRAGSSLSDAVLMESAVNENQLQFAQDAKRRSNENQLSSVLNNLAGNRFNIQQNRIGADIQRDDAAYLRNSYLEGGHNYNLYQNQLEQMALNKGYQYQEANFEQKQHTGINSFMNGLTAFISGGAKGFQTGYNFSNTVYNARKYNTGIGGGTT